MLDPITTALTKSLIPSLSMTTPIVGYLLVVLIKWGKMKIKNEMVVYALERISQTVMTVVTNHMQSTLGGAGVTVDKAAVKIMALADIHSQIPESVKVAAAQGVTDIGKFIEQKLEKAVFDIKTTSKGKGV